MTQRNVLYRVLVLTVSLVSAPTPSLACFGDCNGSGSVTAADLTRMVALILLCGGNPLGCPQLPRACGSGDTNSNGIIDVGDLIAVIDDVLRYPSGCAPASPSPTPTLPEPTHTTRPTDTPSRTPTPEIPTATVTATATPTPTPTTFSAVCGNGLVEPGESCDDGNTVTSPPTDTCPSDCTVITCSPGAERLEVAVRFAAPRSAASVAVIVSYPDGIVQIPGTAADSSVGTRILNRPSGFLADWFDFDYAVRIALVGTRALPADPLFRIQFDICRESSAPASAAAFTCTVVEANDTSFQPIAGATCSVVFP